MALEQNNVVEKLLEHQAHLQASGIVHLRLFGSKARGDDNPRSDVDLMADYDRARKLTLFDKAGLEVEISHILENQVDLCDREMLEPSVRIRAEREAVLVF